MKRYVVTSAQARAKPHVNFLDGIENYAKHNDSEVIILPMIGQNASQDLDQLDSAFDDFDVEDKTRYLNSNIKVEQFHVRPYQIDPLTGLSRFAQRETTKIFASPKQRLKPVAHSSRKMPKYLVTTGACTLPNYATGMDVRAERRRLGEVARRDHIYGALIVEVEDNFFFHMRHIRADSRGRFVDLGDKFDGEWIGDSQLEAMVLGDYHVGRTDSAVEKVTHDMIKTLKPKRLLLHDFFDGHSVNHHMEKQYIQQKLLQGVDYNHHRLEQELQECYQTLMTLNESMEGRDIVLVASNHHEFLNRYLDEGRFMRDTSNARFGFRLADYMSEKDLNDPVEGGIRMIGELPRNVRFLKRNEDYKIRGYQLGAHGDKGPSLGYASMEQKENAWGKSVTGHVHKAQILRDTYTVGTMLPLDMFYMRGHPIDWSHTHGLLWDTGTVQLINIINGKWRMK